MRILLAAAAVLLAGAAAADAPPPAAGVLLGAPDRWKSLTYDAARNMLFVAHWSEITTVDLATRQVVGHVPGLSGAHGVALVPGGHGYASSGKTGEVTVFDPATFAVLATIPSGKDSNAVSYDPASGHVFVMNDDVASITVIDPASDRAMATIPLAAKEGLQAAAADGLGHLFVDHSAGPDVLRIDTAAAAVDATFPLAECPLPSGIAVDAPSARLFVSCVGGTLLVLDARDGHRVAALPIGQGSGDVLFDARRRRIYSANADGTLSVIAVAGADQYAPLPPIGTPPGARNAALDPDSGHIFLLAADVASSGPSITPGGPKLLRFAPGTLRVIEIDPGP